MGSLKEWLAIIVSVLGIFGFIGTVIVYHRAAVIKSYAAERDFNHLRGNQQQMVTLLTQIDDKIVEIHHELELIKNTTTSHSSRLETLVLRLEAQSNFLRRSKDD